MKRKEKAPVIDKANNSSAGIPYKQQKKKLFVQFATISLSLILIFGLMFGISQYREDKIRAGYSSAEFIQYELPSDDTPVVVYETSCGTFKAVLFTEQAPKYCEYFIGLVKSGYYDGTHVFSVQDGAFFLGGSKTADGTDDDRTDLTAFDPERHRDLWPFYGAIAGYGRQKSMFNSQIQAGSRDLFIGSIEFTDELIEQMDSVSDNTRINETFKIKGGVPNFSQQYTIFAQVYDGFDAYDALLSAEVEGDGDLRPKEDIVFKRVYLSTYGENRNDGVFTLEGQGRQTGGENAADTEPLE